MSYFSKGEQVYRYILDTRLGNGNYGEVWTAQDTVLNKLVALKLILSDGLDYTLLDEAKNGYAVRHSNLVEIYNAHVENREPDSLILIAQEYHPKGSVINLYNTYKFIPIKNSVELLIQILKGLDHLHSNQCIHNDIKPSNILLDQEDIGVLCDYGLSQKVNSDKEAITYKGYIPHMAPESFKEHKRTIQTDIYQVGLTAFRLINGDTALEEDLLKAKGNFSLLAQMKSKNKFPNKKKYLSFVPASVKQIINKAINSDPSQRYATALDMRRSLESLKVFGQWDVDQFGNWIGETGDYIYTFESGLSSKLKPYLNTFKENIYTNRKTQCHDLSFRNITAKELQIKQDAILKNLILGKL